MQRGIAFFRGIPCATCPKQRTRRKTAKKPTLRRPCCFGRRGGALFSFPPGSLSRGAERRKTRGLARPSGRLAKPPGTLARHAPFALRSAKGRLSALHLRRFPSGAGTALSGPGLGRLPDWEKAPNRLSVSELLAGVLSNPGRSPGAARARGYEPRPQAPHPIPPSRRLMKTPLGGPNVGIIGAI